MKIVADADLLDVAELFAEFGELLLLPGREIRNRDLLKADVLLVRSITRVDEPLLAGTGVSFVGTATSGSEHVDKQYLAERGIVFRDARGCNANAVADYCMAALAYCVARRGLDLSSSRVGIVGYGHVGSAFASRLRRLGVEVLLNDPPLLASGRVPGELLPRFGALDSVFDCQVVSMHVPLVDSGLHPSRGLVDEKCLDSLPENAVFINSSRGGVVEEAGLVEFLRRRADVAGIIDVWQNEPEIDPELAALATLATPHIAGYSRQAKRAASAALRRHLIADLGLSASHNVACHPRTSELPLGSADGWQAALQALPLERLSREFSQAVQQGASAQLFDSMRRRLAGREEFASLIPILRGSGEMDSTLLQALGFADN